MQILLKVHGSTPSWVPIHKKAACLCHRERAFTWSRLARAYHDPSDPRLLAHHKHCRQGYIVAAQPPNRGDAAGGGGLGQRADTADFKDAVHPTSARLGLRRDGPIGFGSIVDQTVNAERLQSLQRLDRS
jgi:hypothetical protein